MKKRMSKLLLALIVLSGFAVSVLGGNFDTEAADESQTYVVENYTADDASPFFKNNTAPICKTDGYIFAGWYAEDDTVVTDETTGEENFTGNPVVTLVGYMHENVKALFVEESVLDVKGQIAILDNEDGTADDGNMDVATVTDTTKANLRLVTSVDSLKYQKVGFEISYTYGETPVSTGSVTNYVYKNLTVVDGTDGAADEKMVPSKVFSKRSQYFKACTVNGVPKDAFDTDFSVRSYWVTADGATVYGSSTALNKSVQAGIYHTYEAGVDTTYYKVLEDAVGSVAASETEANVTVFKDAEVEGNMSITGQVNITNHKGKNVKLTRGNGLSSANMFSVSSTGTLKIIGTTDENSIMLDGDNISATVAMIFSNNGVFKAQNATIQNVVCTHASNGGAIQATKGELHLTNTKFYNNKSKYGGAVRVSGLARITGCTFGEEKKGNTATADGGAIYSQSTDMNIVDTTFVANEATVRGGAIYANTAVMYVYNTLFDGNKVLGNTSGNGAGGAVYNNDSTLEFYAKNENEKFELAKFENNEVSDIRITFYGGGAICNGKGTLKIDGYEFNNNHSTSQGGAISIRYGTLELKNSYFNENYTSGMSSHGGAISVAYTSKASITTSDFTNNGTKTDGALGGALYISNVNATLNEGIGNEANTYSGNYITVDSVAQENNVYIVEE